MSWYIGDAENISTPLSYDPCPIACHPLPPHTVIMTMHQWKRSQFLITVTKKQRWEVWNKDRLGLASKLRNMSSLYTQGACLLDQLDLCAGSIYFDRQANFGMDDDDIVEMCGQAPTEWLAPAIIVGIQPIVKTRERNHQHCYEFIVDFYRMEGRIDTWRIPCDLNTSTWPGTRSRSCCQMPWSLWFCT